MKEMAESKDDKEDNSYSKEIKSEEKGDTIMKFNTAKSNEKLSQKEYNLTDPNNADSQNNYNDSHLKTENKIKLNPEILKQSKMNIEKNLIEQNEKDKNNDKNEEVIDVPPGFGGIGGNFFTKINRCFSDKAIMVITTIMLLYSILFLGFSILDFIKSMRKKEKNNFFMNSTLFIIFDIINISSILIYHMMNYYLKPKLSHNIILLLCFLLVIVSVLRLLNYAKKNSSLFAILINLCQHFFTNIINGLTLYFFFLDTKKRKNAMHGIEEIINFTELNANIKGKKEEGLQLDIISSKEKPASLVEEEVDNPNNNNNEGK